VIAALHDFQTEVSGSNTNKDDDRHDALLSRLEWSIREDLSIPGNPPMNEFKARVVVFRFRRAEGSGLPPNQQLRLNKFRNPPAAMTARATRANSVA